MSKLLINEHPLIVLPSLAEEVGINEAIVLQQLHYWLDNPKVGKLWRGKSWVRNSVREWQEDDEGEPENNHAGYFGEQEKPKTLYNWSNAPKNALFAAVDEDGRGFWYGEEYSGGSWSLGFARIDPIDILHTLPAAESLEKRPG